MGKTLYAVKVVSVKDRVDCELQDIKDNIKRLCSKIKLSPTGMKSLSEITDMIFNTMDSIPLIVGHDIKQKPYHYYRLDVFYSRNNSNNGSIYITSEHHISYYGEDKLLDEFVKYGLITNEILNHVTTITKITKNEFDEQTNS